jgi:hypothetical protein
VLKGAANQDGDPTLTVAEMEAYLTDRDDGMTYASAEADPADCGTG